MPVGPPNAGGRMPFRYAGLPRRVVRRRIFLFSSVLCGIALLGACAEPTGPSDPAVIPDQYIVQFREDAQDIPGLAKKLVEESGGTLRFTYTAAIKGFSARLPAHAIAALQRNPAIENI